jgi:hypothetical protein
MPSKGDIKTSLASYIRPRKLYQTMCLIDELFREVILHKLEKELVGEYKWLKMF